MRVISTANDADGASYVGQLSETADAAGMVALHAVTGQDAAALLASFGDGESIVPVPPGGSVAYLLTLVPGDPAPFHGTPTIDYVFVLDEGLELMLDKETVVLRPQDLVVQRGTNHAWRATGETTSSFVAVMTTVSKSGA